MKVSLRPPRARDVDDTTTGPLRQTYNNSTIHGKMDGEEGVDGGRIRGDEGAAAEEDADDADGDGDEDDDDDEDMEWLSALSRVSTGDMFTNMFANLFSDGTPDEPWPEDVAGVQQLIDDGKDPFQTNQSVFMTGPDRGAPFHQASERRDLEILLLMAGSPTSPTGSETKHH